MAETTTDTLNGEFGDERVHVPCVVSEFQHRPRLVLPPHPLMPFGHTFQDNDEMIVMPGGSVLPPIEFSLSRLEDLERIARHGTDPQGQFFYTPEVVLMATYLTRRRIQRKDLLFDEQRGCWGLPLPAEHDSKGRARYPSISLNGGQEAAHRFTYRILMGKELEEGTHGDHLYHWHPCCNPYHNEPVSPAVNTWRGRVLRFETHQTTLFGLPQGRVAVRQLVALMEGIQ